VISEVFLGFNSSDIGIFTNQEKYKSNMRKNYVTMLCLAMMRVACGQQTKQKETTMEFTDQVKEALAYDLLSKGNIGVTDVAYKVGFKNRSHFTKSFKEHFGKSPSEIGREMDIKRL
jgi:AraC-like DNA-binding protein